MDLRRLAAFDLKKITAEAIGTFWLTFGGCGSAVMAAAFPDLGIGLLGVAFAFGLTLLTMAYAIGHISGCHINPAVTLGLAAAGRFPANQILPHVAAQIVGAIIGAALLYIIASGAPGFDVGGGFAANGYGEHSPGHYPLTSCLLTEVIMMAMFLFIIMGSTHGRAPVGFAPLAIGLGLTLIPKPHALPRNSPDRGRYRTGSRAASLPRSRPDGFAECRAPRLHSSNSRCNSK